MVVKSRCSESFSNLGGVRRRRKNQHHCTLFGWSHQPMLHSGEKVTAVADLQPKPCQSPKLFGILALALAQRKPAHRRGRQRQRAVALDQVSSENPPRKHADDVPMTSHSRASCAAPVSARSAPAKATSPCRASARHDERNRFFTKFSRGPLRCGKPVQLRVGVVKTRHDGSGHHPPTARCFCGAPHRTASQLCRAEPKASVSSHQQGREQRW